MRDRYKVSGPCIDGGFIVQRGSTYPDGEKLRWYYVTTCPDQLEAIRHAYWCLARDRVRDAIKLAKQSVYTEIEIV